MTRTEADMKIVGARIGALVLTMLVVGAVSVAPASAGIVNFFHGFHSPSYPTAGLPDAQLSAGIGADVIRVQMYWQDYQTGVDQFNEAALENVADQVRAARFYSNNSRLKAVVIFDLPGCDGSRGTCDTAWMQAAGYNLQRDFSGGRAPRYYPESATGLYAYGDAAGRALRYFYDAGVADFIETPNEPNIAHGPAEALPPEKVGQLGANAIVGASNVGLQLNGSTGPAVLIGALAIGQNDWTTFWNMYPLDYFRRVQELVEYTLAQRYRDAPNGPSFAVTLMGTWRPSFHAYPRFGGNEGSPCDDRDPGSGYESQDETGDLTGAIAAQTVRNRLAPLVSAITFNKKYWVTETGMTSYKNTDPTETQAQCRDRRNRLGGSAYGKAEQSSFYSSLAITPPAGRLEGMVFFLPQDSPNDFGQFAGYGVHSPGPVQKPAAGAFQQWYGNAQALNPGPIPWANANIGGELVSDPDVAAWGVNRLDVFGRGRDNALWHRAWNGTSWGAGWDSLGGELASGVGAVSWGANRIDVVGRARNGNVVRWTYNGSAWSTDNLGGIVQSTPDISSWGSGRLDMFARGMDDALYHRAYSGGRWGAWENLGGTLTSGPSAVSWGVNRIDVVARVSDRSVRHWAFNGTTWASDNLGAVVSSDPEIASWGSGRLDVFVRGQDGALWHRAWNGSSWGSGWDSLGGYILSGPGAVSWGPNRLDVFARAANKSMHHWAWP